MSKKSKVMVLDDEALVCERLKEFLQSDDMDVETFTDPKAAVERLKEEDFEVVVTDLKMAGLSGMDVIRFVRDEKPSTQVILITAYGQLEVFHEAKIMGAYEIVNKPFKMADIRKLVKKATKRKKKHG